jgi:tetratricopeptide (TPR) repeat protein
MVYWGLKASLRAAKPSYSSMLSVLGDLDADQGQQKEALAMYDKAKALLVHDKERCEYGGLLNNMGGCHRKLSQWNKAVACLKEAVATFLDLTILSPPPHCRTSPLCSPCQAV